MSELAERYDSKIFRVMKGTSNLRAAEEAVRQAFLKAYEQLQQFRQDSQYLTGLIEIALHQPLSELAERYDSKIFRVVKGTNNQREAEEAVRQAFLKAYEQLQQFREDSRYLTGLIEIALHQSLMKLER